MDYKSKWSNYKIGKTGWINKRSTHPSRELFMSHVLRLAKLSDRKLSVLEIGPGECFEAKRLKDVVDYTVCDISKPFLDNAKKCGFNTINSDIMDLPKHINKKYDIVYCCCVLEHVPDLIQAINNIKKAGHTYFITMFRWNYGGNTKSHFHKEVGRSYYTSTFDINKIFVFFGIVFEKTICKNDHSILNYKDYVKTINKHDPEHRTGNWLSFWG